MPISRRFPRRSRQPTIANMMDMGEDVPRAEGNFANPGVEDEDYLSQKDPVELYYQNKTDFKLRLPEIDLDQINHMVNTQFSCSMPTLDSFAAFADDADPAGEMSTGSIDWSDVGSTPTPNRGYVAPAPTQNAFIDALTGLTKAAGTVGTQYVTNRLAPKGQPPRPNPLATRTTAGGPAGMSTGAIIGIIAVAGVLMVVLAGKK